MTCAHCGQTLRVARSILIPRWDGGFRCDACGRFSYVREGERIRRTFFPLTFGLMPLLMGNAILNAFIGWWSLLVSGAIGIPIYAGAAIWAYRRCETVPELPESVLERRRTFAKYAASGLSVCGLFLILGLLGFGNPIIAAVGLIATFLIVIALGFATLFHNVNEGG